MALIDQNPKSLSPIEQGQWAAAWIPILRGRINGIIQNGTGGSLPDQSGHAGEFLTTDGSIASWAPGGDAQNIDQVLARGGQLSADRQIDFPNQSLAIGDVDSVGNLALISINNVDGALDFVGKLYHIYDTNSGKALNYRVELTDDRIRIEPDKNGIYALLDDTYTSPVVSVDDNDIVLDSTNSTVFIAATGHNLNVTLPTIDESIYNPITGRSIIYRIKRTDSNGGRTITVTPQGGATIDGQPTADLGALGSIVVQTDGTNWWIISA